MGKVQGKATGLSFHSSVTVTNVSGADTGPVRVVFTLNEKRVQLLGLVDGHLGKNHPFFDIPNLISGQTLPETGSEKPRRAVRSAPPGAKEG